MRARILLLWLSATLVGCIRFERPPEVVETGVVSDTDTDVDTDTDTGRPLPEWLTRVGTDSTLYADLGLEVITYAMGPTSPGGYRDPDGGDPRFHIIKPATFTDPLAAHPVLMWLHGNAQGIEGDADYGAHCGAAGIEPVVTAAIEERAFVAAEVANREWIWIIPENPWCDLWSGLGADDPVDPAHHGTEHVQTILDLAEAGFSDILADPARIYGWGTSIGGAGILVSSYGDGLGSRFAAVVPDSGPVGVRAWYDVASEQPYLDHILGGPPTDESGEPSEFWDSYSRMDGSLLVEERGYRVPMFLVWNEFDGLVPPRQASALADRLDTFYAAEGVRYFHHDFAHHAPGALFHVQTSYERPPFSYTNRAAFAFLEGANVAYFEAESTCQPDACTIVAESGSGELEAVSAFSHGSAVVADTPDGLGVMYIGRLPDIVPRGVGITILPVLAGEQMGDAAVNDGVVTLDLKHDGASLSTVTIRRGDLAADLADTHATFYAQIDRTTWRVDTDGDGVPDPLPTEGDVTIQAFYQGRGKVWLDGFWVLW